MTVDSGSIKTALGECWGEKLQPLCAAGRAGWRVGARLDRVGGGGGDTAHAQLSSAHTHTDLRQENGSSLNLTILAINFLPESRGRYLGWSTVARGLQV